MKIEGFTQSRKALSLRIRSRGFFQDRAFHRAILYALLFHIALFGLFRVKSVAPPHASRLSRPVSVICDIPWDNASPGTTQAACDSHWLPQNRSNLAFPSSARNYEARITKTIFSGSPAIPPTFTAAFEAARAAPIILSEPVFPLKIKLSQKLKSLALVEDGSCLFSVKKGAAGFHLPVNTYLIRYDVKVEPGSGKIVQWSRKKELLDKELQNLSDQMIKRIRFAPCSADKPIRGRISMTFFASSEELKGLYQ